MRSGGADRGERMANNGRAGTILQSFQEIRAIVSARIQQKAATSPLVATLAQKAAESPLAAALSGGPTRAHPDAARSATPAEIVAVSDRDPSEGPAEADARAHAAETMLGGGLKTFAAIIPQVARLLWRLTTDPRVPLKHKIVLGGAAAYLISPWDIIPDRIAGAGQLDDLAVVLSALDIVLNHTPDEIVRSHWTGDPRTLDNIRRIVGMASQLRGGG
ncbi:MAG: YkvA family protein, partial [Actinomycetota bacterium]